MREPNKVRSLTPKQRHILVDKGTERPNPSLVTNPERFGTFLCRACGNPLFRAEHQFQSGCGWPSFDNQIEQAITKKKDADGIREEILCQQCEGHLGHVFTGEHFTNRNLRHCVNATAIEFVPSNTILNSLEIIVAGGCFWGVEHWMSQHAGVLIAESGYIGGNTDSPKYDDICRGNSGHYEAVRIVFDADMITIKQLYQQFFECHNPFQFDGQGVDVGPQYRSAIFTYNPVQNDIARQLIEDLEQRFEQPVSTKLLPMSTFWPAEAYHQNYFNQHPNAPICHRPVKRFDTQ